MPSRRELPLISVTLVKPRRKLLRRARTTEIVLGQEKGCDVVLRDLPGICPRHVVVAWKDQALWIHDLGSDHGSFLADSRLGRTPRKITSGARIRLGESVEVEVEVKTTHPDTCTYLFVYDSRKRQFPERYWVKGAPVDPTAKPSEADELDGMVLHEKAEGFMARLRVRYPAPRYAVSRMTASSWSFIEGNFAGLYYH